MEEKKRAHCAETKRLNHTWRLNTMIQADWKARFESLAVHAMQNTPLRSTYLLSVSLQAKIFDAYFTVPSGWTDQRPKNIKALQLPYSSQPVRLSQV